MSKKACFSIVRKYKNCLAFLTIFFSFSKVKLKIKVDPSRFKAAPTSSPSPVQMTPPPMSAPPSVLKLSIPAGVIPSTRPESPAASPTHFDFKCDQVWPPKCISEYFLLFSNWTRERVRLDT